MTTTTRKRLRSALFIVGWMLIAYAAGVATWYQLHGQEWADRWTAGRWCSEWRRCGAAHR